MIDYILSGGDIYGLGFGWWLAIVVAILIVLGIARHFLTSGPAGY